jgi:hypothetical protein
MHEAWLYCSNGKSEYVVVYDGGILVKSGDPETDAARAADRSRRDRQAVTAAAYHEKRD